MKTAIKVALATLIGCGGVLLVLGIIIWTSEADELVPVHIAVGLLLVLSLWTLAVIAWRSGVAVGTVAFAASWGALVVALGMLQEELVPGDLHWTIQVLHLAISMGAIWWGRRLVRLIGRALAAGELTLTHPPVASPVGR